MKEIDFLPEWYKSGQRRQFSYRTQYIILGGIFVLMVVWNFIATNSISKATAGLCQMKARQSQAEGSSEEFARVKNEAAQLQQKASRLDDIGTKVEIADVLAEMSFLINEKIVLSKVDIKAESFFDGTKNKMNSSTAVRPAQSGYGSMDAFKPAEAGDVRFKVVINGVAEDASNVAQLICDLENSPYFCLIYPSFSRNTEVKTTSGSNGRQLQVTEFEVSCYIANYREEGAYFAKETQNKKNKKTEN